MKKRNKIDAASAESTPAAEESVIASAEEAEETVQETPTETAAETAAETPAEAAKAEKTSSAVSAVVKITLPLSIICIVVSLMLAVVNALTADTIAANAAKEKEAAILSIFPEGDSTEVHFGSDGTEIYTVKAGETVIGYCADVKENGFGGAISMMVGVDPSGSVCGVKIVSLSETPGIGSKVKGDGFLAGFRGRDPFVIGENFDAISGATVSSKAVVRAVNRARTAVADMYDFEYVPEEEVQMQLPAVTPVPEVNVPAETSPVSEETQVVSAENTPEIGRLQTNLALFLPSSSITSVSKTVNRAAWTASETIVIDETPETEAPPAETLPPETEAVPAETQPSETLPAETSAPESETTAVTEPAETAETTPVETTPAESAPAIL